MMLRVIGVRSPHITQTMSKWLQALDDGVGVRGDGR